MEFTDIKELKKLMGKDYNFEEGAEGSISKSLVFWEDQYANFNTGDDSSEESGEDEYNLGGARFSLIEEKPGLEDSSDQMMEAENEDDEDGDSFFDGNLLS